MAEILKTRAGHTGRNMVPGRDAGRPKEQSSPIAGPGQVRVPAPRMISAPNRPIYSVRYALKHGTGAALVLPFCNTEAMQLHLDEIATKSPPAHTQSLSSIRPAGTALRSLVFPSNLSLLPLPPRAPELNSQENIWLFMRQNWLSNRIFKSFDDIVDHCCYAWNTLINQPWKIMSIAHRDWAVVGHSI